jgi:hypothetical protein
VLRGIARKSRTILDNTVYLSDLLFHHARISKSSTFIRLKWFFEICIDF